MGMQLNKRCAHAGCRELIPTTETYCAKHKRNADRQYDKQRYRSDPSYIKLYHSKEWRAIREQAMIRDHGLCQECLKHERIEQAKVVDHIKRVDEHPELRLELSNLQSLCKACHNKKTANEMQK
jgi:5-methylcytosine-specific restriction protein A